MHYGCVYYPEHRDESLWRQDAEWMREAHMDLVRLTDFAWCRLEPEEGQFTFDWLARALDVLHGQGIRALLTVPTAGPTTWLVNAARPEDDCRILYEDGQPWVFGGRSMTCPSHPRFQAAAQRIATAMAQRFARHPAVMGWQLDNELGMFGNRCLCRHCRWGFHAWLEAKYGDIASLNRRLGTVFGSNEFRCFDDIPMQRSGQGLHHPGLKLESQRYYQHINAAFLHLEAAALRAAGATQPITHNVCHMYGGWQGQDDPLIFADLDVAGWDCYPVQFAAHPRPETMGLLHSCARAFKGGKRYWMLEQQIGSPNDTAADDLRQVRLWVWQAIAHGAEAIAYFRWDTCRFGSEQYWRGILDHVTRKNSRYHLVAQVGAEVRQHEWFLDRLSRPRNAAVLLDTATCDSWHLNPPGPAIPYRGLNERWTGALTRAGWAPDVVFTVPDPGRYRILIAYGLRLVDQETIARLRAFAAGGGILISGLATATLDREHVCPDQPVPWGLTDVFGCERIEFSPLSPSLKPPKERLGESAANWAELGCQGAVPTIGEGPLAGGCFAADTWCDHLDVQGCAVWARFAEGSPAAGLAAVTSHGHGLGQAIYVAASVDEKLMDAVLHRVVGRDPSTPHSDDPWVEIIPAMDGANPVWFVLNHGHGPATVQIPSACRDLLGGSGHLMFLQAYQVGLLLSTA